MNEQDKGLEGSNVEVAQPVTAVVPEVKSRKSGLDIKRILIVLVLMVVSSAATYLVTSRQNNASKNQISATENSVSSEESSSSSTLPEVKKQNSIQWSAPVKVAKVPIFQDLSKSYNFDDNTSKNAESLVEYFQVGSSDDGEKMYIVSLPLFVGGSDGGQYMFVTEKSGVYTLYKKSSPDVFYARPDETEERYTGPDLKPSVKIDTTTVVEGALVKSELNYKGQSLRKSGGATFLTPDTRDSKLASYKKMADLSEGILYERVFSSDPTYTITNYTLLTKDGRTYAYVINGELSKSDIDPITWNDGSKNKDDYISVGRGCGVAASNEVAVGVASDQLVATGKSDKGQPVYEFKDSSQPLLGKHYKEYKDFDANGTYSESDRGLSLEQFASKHPIYLVQDALGRWLVFSNGRFAPGGGCGKPVVYLYPTTPKLVNVSVDADVTVSEPHYPAGGWKSVFATPSGKLSYGFKAYDSLFWEGYGHGEYPEINKGVVVKREEVVNTWRTQLLEMGLNQKETNDFIDFWTAKIPNTPYVRISWLGTHEMQQLAPLHVSGGVDTLIRVFLDMEGLNEPISIPKQNLFSVMRNGFTVVEWGGLLRDGSVPRVQ